MEKGPQNRASVHVRAKKQVAGQRGGCRDHTLEYRGQAEGRCPEGQPQAGLWVTDRLGSGVLLTRRLAGRWLWLRGSENSLVLQVTPNVMGVEGLSPPKNTPRHTRHTTCSLVGTAALRPPGSRNVA